MEELIVIACHGPDWIGQCRQSLHGLPLLVVDTGPEWTGLADVRIDGGHPTAAYLWAYDNYRADRYLFVQDSMTAFGDPLPWFSNQLPAEGGAVAWGRFLMQWDTVEQRQHVEDQYPGVDADFGIFGPVFYTDRASLDLLAAKDLFPQIPRTRMEAQGTERAWAYAYAAAGLPVVGPEWSHHEMQRQFGPFRKVWAKRP